MKLTVTEISRGWVRLVFEAHPITDARNERIEIMAPAVINRTRPLAEFQLEVLRHARDVIGEEIRAIEELRGRGS